MGLQMVGHDKATFAFTSYLQMELLGHMVTLDFPGGSDGKVSAYSAGDRVQSLGREDLLEKEMAVLVPGKSHGRRSLVGYSPWGHKESDATDRLHFHFSLSW